MAEPGRACHHLAMTSVQLPVKIIVVLTLVLCGACGGTDTQDQSGTEPSSGPATSTATLIDYTKDDDRGAVLRKAADVRRLHDAPADFTHFMAGVVDTKVNSVEPDPDCPFAVTVRKLDTAGFAYGGFISCGGNAEMWAKRDGVWREIWAGQTAPNCKPLEEYSVPKAIAGNTCYDEAAEKDIDYAG